ncbi:MAG: efflux transporter outer membrane subunit [Dokdonella sp.]
MIASVARPLIALAVTLAITSCSIPPKPDAPVLRNEAPLAGLSVPSGGEWPDAQWWTRYHDAQLDDLEHTALAAAPTLDEAHRRFDTAVRAVDIARAAGGLSSQFGAQVQRQRLSDHGLIPSRFLGFSWYNQGDLSLQFRYDFDFWGKQRAAVEAAVDSARAVEAERATATLALTTAVADTYFAWQADRARLELANTTVAALERNHAIAGKRVARGIDLPDTLHQAEAQIAAARESQAAYAGSAPIRLVALGALLGVAPADMPKLVAKPLPAVDPALPDHLGLDLLARRPDISARRWQVEAAMQNVNKARAEFYPDISLGAMVGLSSIDLDKLLTSGSRVAAIGPALHLPVFQLAGLHAAYGVSQAQLAGAASAYNNAVVDAARDVATQALMLVQIDARRDARAAQVAAVYALQEAAAARVRQGVTDDRSLLAVQAQVLQQRDAAVTLHAQAISAELALTKALGGGYRMDNAKAAADRTGSAAR